MARTTTASLEARLAAVEAHCAQLVAHIEQMKRDGLVPLAQRVNEAHSRIDAASQVFNKLRAATVAALRPH